MGVLTAGFSGSNSSSEIDATATASTKIFTNGLLKLAIHRIIVYGSSISGEISVASLSVGTNSASYDNIVGITALTSLTATGGFYIIDLTGAQTTVSANTDIYVKVTTGAVSTTYNIRVTLIGEYF